MARAARSRGPFSCSTARCSRFSFAGAQRGPGDSGAGRRARARASTAHARRDVAPLGPERCGAARAARRVGCAAELLCIDGDPACVVACGAHAASSWRRSSPPRALFHLALFPPLPSPWFPLCRAASPICRRLATWLQSCNARAARAARSGCVLSELERCVLRAANKGEEGA